MPSNKIITHHGISYRRLKRWRLFKNLYELAEQYQTQTGIKGFSFDTDYFSLARNGLLTVRPGYRWDGPSGPTVDTKSFMRGSLCHDVLYQSMRMGKLPQWIRPQADTKLYLDCVEDGMAPFRSKYVYVSVSLFAGLAAVG